MMKALNFKKSGLYFVVRLQKKTQDSIPIKSDCICIVVQIDEICRGMTAGPVKSIVDGGFVIVQGDAISSVPWRVLCLLGFLRSMIFIFDLRVESKYDLQVTRSPPTFVLNPFSVSNGKHTKIT